MALRRLPVLQTSDLEPQRPNWQWTLIGAGLAFTSWLPLALIALWAGPRLAGLVVAGRELPSLEPRARALVAALTVAPIALSFVLACALAGALVAHFGARTQLRQWSSAGALTGVIAASIAWLGGSLAPLALALTTVVVLIGLGAGSAALGAWLTRRRRGGPARTTGLHSQA